MNRSLVLTLALVALVCAPAMAGVHYQAPQPQYVPPQAYEVPCPCPEPVTYVQPQRQVLVLAAPQPCYTTTQTYCPPVATHATVAVAAPLAVHARARVGVFARIRAGCATRRSLRGAGVDVAIGGAGYAQQVAYAPAYQQSVGAYAEGAHAE